jgi:chemotaxis protein methyltransferase CheR
MDSGPAPGLQAIQRHLIERRGLDLSRYKESYLRRRLLVRVRALRLEDLQAYARYLRRHPEEVGPLQRALSIKVTGLFRNESCFAFLRETVVPELMRRAVTRRDRVSVWSAGCATGEEAYSAAALFAAVGAPAAPAAQVRVTGTDIDEGALQRCRSARFPAPQLRGTIPEVARQFDPLPDGTVVPSAALRRMVRFERENLLEPFRRDDLDLILCRNVLIYFSLDHQETILQRFARALSVGGYLVLGRVERLFGPARGSFEVASTRDRVYRRNGAPCD